MALHIKIKLAIDTEVAFVLTSGRQDAGIASESGHPRRHCYYHNASRREKYVDPDTCLAATANKKFVETGMGRRAG